MDLVLGSEEVWTTDWSKDSEVDNPWQEIQLIQSFQALSEKLDLEVNKLFQYFQMRDYYFKEIKLEEPEELHMIITIMIVAY